MVAPSARIQLLGTFRVSVAQRTLIDHRWQRRKAASLLKLLAIQPGRRLHREIILDHLWPEMDGAAALNNLHKAAHYLRQPFVEAGLPPIATVAGSTFELAPDVMIDVEEFTTLADNARRRRTDLDAGLQALGAYPGPLLPDDLYEEWTEPARANLRTVRAKLLLGVARLFEMEGDFPAAIASLEQLREEEGHFEEAQRGLMRAYALAGNTSSAEREFERCRDMLAKELGVEPTAATQRLHEEITSGRFQPGLIPHFSILGSLIGRGQEADRLYAAFDEACAGHGGVVVVEGEPGVGKTRLAQEIARAAWLRDAQVLWGRCDVSLGTPAYWPWMQALEPFQREEAGGDGSAEPAAPRPFARLLPGDSQGASDRQQDGRRQLFMAVMTFLSKAAAVQPVVLVLDDLHDADEASLQLLRHVVRNIAHQRILVVASLRDSEEPASAALRPILADIARDQLKARISLSGLSDQEVGSFVEVVTGQQPAQQTTTILHQRTGGNPLFISECAQLLLTAKGTAHPLTAHVVPATVREVVLQRVKNVSGAAKDTLLFAAVVGEEVDVRVLNRVVGHDAHVVIDALAELHQAKLIQPRAGGVWTFSHGLIRDALYGTIRPSEAAVMHAEVGRALEQRPRADLAVAQLAYHFVQAAQAGGDTSSAITYSVEAGEADLGVFAWEGVVAHWLTAARLIEDDDAHSEALADLLERIETIIFSAGGDYRVGLDCLRRALPIRESLGQRERVAQIHSRLGRALSTHIGDPRLGKYMDLRDALQHYQQAEPTFSEGPARPAKAYFYAAMATTAFNAVRLSEGVAAAETAVRVAAALDSPPITASARLMEGLFLKAAGELCRAADVLADVYDIADRENVPSLVYYAVTSIGDWQEGYVAGRGELFELELAKPRFADAGMFRTGLIADLASAFCLSGMLARARELMHSATPGDDSLLAFWDGDFARAETTWSDGYAVLVQAGARSAYANRAHQLADLFRVRGEYARAEQMRLNELQIALDGGSRLIEYRARGELALLYAEMRRIEDASAQLAALDDLANCRRWGRRAGRAQLSRALLAKHAQLSSADASLEQASACFHDLALPWDRAETYVQWARICREQQDAVMAEALRRKAVGIYADIGAGSAWIERAERIAHES